MRIIAAAWRWCRILAPYGLILLSTLLIVHWTAPASRPPSAGSTEEYVVVPYDRLHLRGGGQAREALKDLPVVVLFADARVERQLASLKENVRLRANHPFHVVVVSNDPNAVERAVGKAALSGALFTEPDQFDNLLALFQTSIGNPWWFVYDRHASLVARGRFDSAFLVNTLRKVVDREGELTGQILAAGFQGKLATDLLAGLSKVRRFRGAAAVLLIEKAQSGCSEFEVMRHLAEASKTSTANIVILPLGDLTVQDGRAMARDFGLPFEVVGAPRSVQEWWTAMKTRYGLATVNASVLFVKSNRVQTAALRLSDIERGLRQYEIRP